LAGGRFGRATPFTEREKAFFSEAVFLLKTFFFVYLGLSLSLGNGRMLLLASILVIVKVLIRIPFVRLAMPRTETARDASLMSAMASMGLASAVLASLPLQEGMEDGALIRDLTYAIILASILANSVLVFLLDRTPFGKIYGTLYRGFASNDRSSRIPGNEPVVHDSRPL
jgi:NhaP-type Na+/H+ or K+/H+ antiporter